MAELPIKSTAEAGLCRRANLVVAATALNWHVSGHYERPGSGVTSILNFDAAGTRVVCLRFSGPRQPDAVVGRGGAHFTSFPPVSQPCQHAMLMHRTSGYSAWNTRAAYQPCTPRSCTPAAAPLATWWPSSEDPPHRADVARLVPRQLRADGVVTCVVPASPPTPDSRRSIGWRRVGPRRAGGRDRGRRGQGPNPTGLLDLRIYRDAAGGIAHGTLYDYQDPNFGLGFTYPPFAALLFAGLRAIPVRVLEFGWTLLGATSWLVFLAYLWRRTVRDRAPDWARALPRTSVAGVWLLSLFGAPVWLTLNQGQVGIFLSIAIGADVVFTVDRRRGAGILTGVAAATKVLPLIAIPLYVIGDRIPAARRALLTFAGLTLLGLAVLPSDSRRYWTDLLWSTRVGETGDVRNDSVLGLVSRILGGGWPTTALWLALAIAVLVLGAISFRAAVANAAPLTAIVVLGSTMSLLSPITWTHHLVFLSLLLLYPVLSWRDRPVVSAIALAMVTVVLIDPLGAGNADSPVGSSVRALVMLAILVFHSRLIGLEHPRRPQALRQSRSRLPIP